MAQVPIAPLIPLPANDQPPDTVDDKDDLFATLFSPPTPRASPSPGPGGSKPSHARAHSHTRSVSSDSFGDFVSVAPAEDPLLAHTDAAEPVPFTPIQNLEFFGSFTEHAAEAAEKNKHEILDELLQHEDDPLYLLKSDGAGSGTATPIPSTDSHRATSPPRTMMTPPQQDLLSPTDPPSISSQQASPPGQDFSSQITSAASSLASSAAAAASSVLSSSPHLPDLLSSSLHDARSSSPFRTPVSQPATSASPLHISPSARPSEPTTQSYFAPASFSAPSRWVSSILSGAKSPGKRGASPETPASPASKHFSHAAATLPTILPSQLRDTLSAMPRTGSLRAPKPAVLDAAITHGTPFGTHAFEGASGAPGFAGDRAWDKGFEFEPGAERRGVRLAGRREATTGVLSNELADTLRPHLPALARLPRSWTLLYSLDQHGISLNTLYARCANHTGGALLVLRDARDAVFGAWLGEGIHKSAGAYYGSGESFLWRTVDGRVRVYKWTGKNDYVSLCETDYMSFGGGEGRYGLYVDSNLTDGSSARCPTFENEPLCGAGPRQGESVVFECVGLEVWGVG